MELLLSPGAQASNDVCEKTAMQSIVIVHFVLHLKACKECKVRSRARALSETRD